MGRMGWAEEEVGWYEGCGGGVFLGYWSLNVDSSDALQWKIFTLLVDASINLF